MSGDRAWKNGDGWVMLPSANNGVVFVFTHFLKHFYKGGIGLVFFPMIVWNGIGAAVRGE